MNTFTDNAFEELTLEKLLEKEELRGERTMLRKAFADMLDQSARDGDSGYAQMVLETAWIILEDMNLGAGSVKCLMLKNVADKGVLSPEKIESEYGKPVRGLIEGIHKLERLDTKKYSTNTENFIGLLLTLSDDIRVLLIRLGMRLYDIFLNTRSNSKILSPVRARRCIFPSPTAWGYTRSRMKWKTVSCGLSIRRPTR